MEFFLSNHQFESQTSNIPIFRTKLISLGDEGVGKTSLLENLFPIGLHYSNNSLLFNGQKQISWFQLQDNKLIQYSDPQLKMRVRELDLLSPGTQIGFINKEGTYQIQINPGIFKKSLSLIFNNKSDGKSWKHRLLQIIKKEEVDQKFDFNLYQVNYPIITEDYGEVPLQLMIWDFKCQKSYETPNFYFSPSVRTVLLITWKMIAEDKGIENLEFWLHSLLSHFKNENERPNEKKMFSIYIVGTHLDELTRDDDFLHYKINRINRLQQVTHRLQFSLPFEYFEVNSLEGEGIEELRESIIKNVMEHGYMKNQLPPSYLMIQSLILKLQEGEHSQPFMEFEQFKKEIRQFSGVHIEEETIKEALDLFHSWNLCIYFRYSPISDKIIFHPQQFFSLYISKLYQFKNEKFFENGKTDLNSLEQIWTKSIWFDAAIDFLESTHFCFRTFEEDGLKIIFPSKLPLTNPEIVWDEKHHLEFIRILQFNFLPKEFFSQLLVSLHFSFFENQIWRTGIFATTPDFQLLIESHLDQNRIAITFRGLTADLGKEKIEVVINKIESFQELYPGIIISQLTPCFKHESQDSQDLIEILDCLKDFDNDINHRKLICSQQEPIDSKQILLKAGFIGKFERFGFFFFFFFFLCF